ncbi:hypothetical protein RhiirA4_412915, partial [Rhizophagus irregularis]
MDFLSRGGACKHLRASVLWINWLRLQSSQLQYYHLLDHRSLPYISLPSRDDAIKKVKDHQNKLALSYIKDQYIDEKDFNNNYIQNNTEIQSSCLHTQIHKLATSPSTSSPSRVYSFQPEETMLTGSLNIKQDAAPSTLSPSR